MLQEKEKLLVMSNFSFSHSVFKRLVLQTRKNQGLFGKGLRGKNMQQRKFTITRFLTHNYQVMSLTGSPMSHLDKAKPASVQTFRMNVGSIRVNMYEFYTPHFASLVQLLLQFESHNP